MGKIVCRNYTIIEKLDYGSFGMIFKAEREIIIN